MIGGAAAGQTLALGRHKPMVGFNYMLTLIHAYERLCPANISIIEVNQISIIKMIKILLN